ncbi:transposase [Nitrosomonas sp.]|uniref:transposase n=1 Tax=Nitrosomonas sp. TaxID=42353 RepID=UPI002843CB24|nr:transposase [Nitrosomonas sp.]MDR4513163.1 transposase [Nitrosomonas sp.]
MSKKRRNHSPEFKSKVALAAIKGDKTLTELSQQYGINSNLIVKWKRQLIDQSSEVFASSKGLAPDRESEIQSLQAKIGQLTIQSEKIGCVCYGFSSERLVIPLETCQLATKHGWTQTKRKPAQL